MEQAEIIEFTRQALLLIIQISTPIMMIGLIVLKMVEVLVLMELKNFTIVGFLMEYGILMNLE